MKHLEDNLGAVDWHLSEEQRERLNQVSAVEGPYPYW